MFSTWNAASLRAALVAEQIRLTALQDAVCPSERDIAWLTSRLALVEAGQQPRSLLWTRGTPPLGTAIPLDFSTWILIFRLEITPRPRGKSSWRDTNASYLLSVTYVFWHRLYLDSGVGLA